MEFSNLSQMFYYQAGIHAKKRYLSFNNKYYTYGEAAGIVSRIARVLKQKGVKKGSKVIILLNNSPEFIFSVFALFTCGAIVIPLNIFLKEREVLYIINNSEAEFLITSSKFSEIITTINEKLKLKEIFTYDDDLSFTVNIYKEIINISDEPSVAPTVRDDIAMFIYTSGTTGNPKGVILTHGNLLSNLEACSQVLGSAEKDRFLVVLPMFHTYTFTACLMLPTYLGASIIILSSVMDMKKSIFKKILIFQRPTFLLGVPQIFSLLAKAKMPWWFIKFIYPIKMHISGGAPLSMETFEQFKKKFGKPVIEGYGLSEASPAVAFNPISKQKPGTVGVVMPNMEAKIVDSDDMEVARGNVGELILKGPNIMQGYWKVPKATDDAIRNGWLFTGDMATMDEEGYITIVDRKKDLILSKGMNVYPREIEEVIYKYPGVDAVGVIGIHSEENDEMIAAYIQAKPENTINIKELKQYLKQELANFKLPKIIKIVDNIPVTATGKVLKRKLKEMVNAGLI